MKRFFDNYFIHLSTIAGAALGYLVLHPFVMIVAEFFHMHPNGKLHLHWGGILPAAAMAFDYNQWPMAAILAVMSGGIGFLWGKTINDYRIISDFTKRFSSIGISASSVIHDLNNAIAIINAFAEILKQELKDPEQITYCDTIQSATLNVERMVRDIKTVALNPDAVFLVLEPTDIRCFVERIVRNTRMRARVEIDDFANFVIPIDQGYFERVIWNLLKNADEALEKTPDPLIQINCSKVNNDLIIVLKDNGPGIPEHIKKDIFILGTTHGKRGGTGIGLYSSKKIVEAHKGKIWFESYPDKGTAFFIKLPT
jgi:signal transduction histidine kinase